MVAKLLSMLTGVGSPSHPKLDIFLKTLESCRMPVQSWNAIKNPEKFNANEGRTMLSMSDCLVVIPARGGSKRVPGKNVRLFRGKPLIAWTISNVLSISDKIDVVVSTDDENIAKIAEAAGAQVPFLRPQELATDQAPTVPVISHAVQFLSSNGREYERVFCVYPTAVSLDPKHMLSALESAESMQNWNYIVSVIRYSHPIQRALVRDERGILNMEHPSHALVRTQDLPPRWFDAGQFYLGKSETWIRQTNLLDNAIGIEIPPWEATDIDREEDWELAELLHKVTDARSERIN